jgi:hypothetical protein
MEDKITTNFAYRQLPSVNSNFAKCCREDSGVLDDVLSIPKDEDFGCKVIEVNLEG